LYCCTRGLAASAASTNCSELLPRSARGRIITRMKRLGRPPARANTGSGPLSYHAPPRPEEGERPAGAVAVAPPLWQRGAGPRGAVGMGAAAGQKRDAVAAQEKLARGQGRERRGKFLPRGHAGRSARGRRSKVETPAGRARRGGDKRRRAFAVPGLAVAQRVPRDRRAAVREEDHARGRRQRERRAVRQHIFVKREHGRHGVAFLVGWATALPLPTR